MSRPNPYGHPPLSKQFLYPGGPYTAARGHVAASAATAVPASSAEYYPPPYPAAPAHVFSSAEVPVGTAWATSPGKIDYTGYPATVPRLSTPGFHPAPYPPKPYATAPATGGTAAGVLPLAPLQMYGPPSSAPYAGAGQAGPPSSEAASSRHHRLPRKGERPWTDVWAAVLWLGSVGIVVWLAIVNIRYSTINNENQSNSDLSVENQVRVFIAVVIGGVGLGGILTALWYQLMRHHPTAVISGSMLAAVAFAVGNAVLALVSGQWVVALVLLVIAGLGGLFFFFARTRIAFTAALLVQSLDITTRFKGTLVFAFLLLLLQVAWLVLIGFTTMSIVRAQRYGLLVVMAFAYLWTQQVLINIVHMAVSHVVASWYFFQQPYSTRSVPANPMLHGAKIAATNHLGSIAVGSAIVAFVQTLRYMLHGARQSSALQSQALYLIVDFLLSLLEWLIQFFNQYAYTYVVLYGKNFFRSSRDAWNLMKSVGMDALSTYSLVNVTVSVSAAVVGLLCGLGAGLYVYLSIDGISSYWWVAALAAFFLGYTVLRQIGTVISSSVSTIFVCFAEDPTCQLQNNPNFYAILYRGLRGDYDPKSQQRISAV